MGHNRSRNRQPSGKKFKHPSLLKRINRNAAGIDCGSETHYVAVPPERDPEPVRSFKTFTSDLHRLTDWLKACKIKTVAMESTGVYWIPIFEILEERGFEVVLINARHIKNVPVNRRPGSPGRRGSPEGATGRHRADPRRPAGHVAARLRPGNRAARGPGRALRPEGCPVATFRVVKSPSN